ncbi:MAG: DUF2927 domain-containing protein [Leptospiraceae bacterium]|nr:DUF2927 domain-containing protein [Leptospiraceae bacterium]
MRTVLLALIASTSLTFGSCRLQSEKNPQISEPLSETIIDQRTAVEYYKKIALGSEYGNGAKQIKKWQQDLRVWLRDSDYPDLTAELDRIIVELNQLSSTIRIRRVTDRTDANFIVFLSSAAEYADFEPDAEPYLQANWGLVWINWNSRSEIYAGSMYVDVFRTQTLAGRKHLLREEFTQGLGLLNDTYDYKDSIFYQGWTTGQEYSPIDRELIRMHLGTQVKPAMSAADIDAIDWRF